MDGSKMLYCKSGGKIKIKKGGKMSKMGVIMERRYLGRGSL